LTYRKFLAFTFNVSMCRSGTYMSRGWMMGCFARGYQSYCRHVLLHPLARLEREFRIEPG
jgi:hypothetical protein